MKRIILLALPVISSLLLHACSSAITSRDAVYNMSGDEADQLILETIQSNWPEQPAYPLGNGKVGYSFPHTYGGEQGSVSIEAEPVGDDVYRFVVESKGKAESIGNPQRLIILGLLDARAAGID